MRNTQMDYVADELQKLLEKARTPGTRYVEVMCQKQVSEKIEAENNVLKSFDSESFNGLGVRLIHEGSMGFFFPT
jgi:predicted Zn-dependent protease